MSPPPNHSNSGESLRVLDPFARQDPFYSEEFNPHEEEFNDGIREITILILIGMSLLSLAYAFLTKYQRSERDEEFLPYSWEDEIVYKTSFAICTFSLAVSFGAALLLPISTISNEILHHYPASWYMKWLNSSLIHGIWNLIFILSNMSLFVFLPFAYLFCESEGLPFLGNRRGLIARAKETVVTLLLLCLIVLGMMYVIAALVDRDEDSINKLLNVFVYLPFLYSCVSFLGVLMLLICTPLGFARLFTIVGDLVIKPTFLRNLDEEFFASKFEEDSLKQKVADYQRSMHQRLAPISSPSTGLRLQNGEILLHYQEKLSEASAKRESLDRARRTPIWRRVLGYPFVMLVLLVLTGISLICVISNVGQIVVGFRSLPIYKQTVDLGITSLSSLGVFGVLIEVVLIGYLFITSSVGLYTIPVIKKIKPMRSNTSLTHIILNCGLYVILSSALPLLSKILGITNFDLLGSFGKVNWLGNYYLVLLYNAVFAVAASLCLFNKFTARVRQEIFRRFALVLNNCLPLKMFRQIRETRQRTLRYISSVFKKAGLNQNQLGVVTTPVSSTAPVVGLKTE